MMFWHTFTRLFRMPSLLRFSPLLASILASSLAQAETRPLTLERDVRPILREHCYHCHGEGEKLKGGVDLRLRRFMERPSESGAPVLVPGHPDQSEMITLIREGEMPAKGKKLPPEKIAILEQWIAQ